MKEALIINARFKGNDERFDKNEVYRLEIRNAGAVVGRAAGNHDVVTIPALNISCPYTVRGFLLNWEVIEVLD